MFVLPFIAWNMLPWRASVLERRVPFWVQAMSLVHVRSPWSIQHHMYDLLFVVYIYRYSLLLWYYSYVLMDARLAYAVEFLKYNMCQKAKATVSLLMLL